MPAPTAMETALFQALDAKFAAHCKHYEGTANAYAAALSALEREFCTDEGKRDAFKKWQCQGRSKVQNFGTPDREADISAIVAARRHAPLYDRTMSAQPV